MFGYGDYRNYQKPKSRKTKYQVKGKQQKHSRKKNGR